MVLPAYLASCAYLWKICEDNEYPTTAYVSRSMALISAIIGSLYALWLIYAAGLQYLLMAIIFMALGIPVYIWARRQNSKGEKVFTKHELILAAVLVIIALFAVYAMATGIVKV